MDIRKIREELNMSQSQFANKFHLSVKTLQRWEQGKTKVPESIYYMINKIYELEKKDK
ncbi:helix-turn-helix domain-containing protein [Lachnospira multipara]|uniref:Helix-turn-helix n=1 Tax=Lachnospira multipara TaxID=28051 RepID=A0A1H5VVT7_9FIRM|nr:helix-turn-helix domain-containing protein [Lachnospira multipara]SEF91372.1 Helix-turn-helix [Lachnospira multipara]